jgi:hypothetical protein
LSYRPAVVFCHLRFIAPSSPQKKSGLRFKIIFFFKFLKIVLIPKLRNLQLRKSRKVCNPVVDMFFEQLAYEYVKDAALEPAVHTI